MRNAVLIFNTAALALCTVLLAVAVPAHAAYRDPAWKEPPAWTATIAPGKDKLVPRNVCPFGISDYAAYRGRVRHDDMIGVYGSRDIFNLYKSGVSAHIAAIHRLRVYVFCG